jgi:AcrR family transcriptional regulator
MTRAGTKRSDPRSETTRVALIEAAESLFAQFGLEAVSMRQIGAAIGSGNTRVVAYHFGTMDDLIEAIYRYRLPAMDERRRELLHAAETAGQGNDIARLLRIICLPFFEQVDAAGSHSYGRFLFAMLKKGRGPTPLLIDDPFPVTTQIWGRIVTQLPVEGAGLRIRMHMTNAMMLDAFQLIDAGREMHGTLSVDDIFEDALAMIFAALTAPPYSA